MGSFFSVRLAPGVRISASSRGLRAHVGPRGARVHVGGGRTGISTGAGPFTFYQSVGGRTRRPAGTDAPRSGRTMTSAQADKLSQAQQIVAQLRAVDDLHRQSFPPAVKPVAEMPALPPFATLLEAAEREHRKGIHLWQRTRRREAKAAARVEAEADAQRLLADAQSQQASEQATLDERWRALLANDEDTVLTVLEHAFEDNQAPVAAVGVEAGEVSLVVLVPPVDVLPERMPSTTPAGNLSLRAMTKSARAAAYLTLVSGHVLVSVKEALAVAPGLTAARVVALREEPADVYGARRAVPLLATRLTRSGLTGVRWETSTAWDVVAQTGTDTVVNPKGAAHELAPLDLTREPSLRELVDAVDLRELTHAEEGAR